MADKRIPALDGVRGIAILMVLIHHFGQAPGFDHFPRLVRGLWVGVDLFFVLSGFLITGILLHTRKSPHYFRNFYARRTLRIFPLYYAVIFTAVFAAWFIPSMRGVWVAQGWLWSYGTNIKLALAGNWCFQFGPLQLNHFWSLAVEEHFYLVWPAVVMLLPRRQLTLACALIMIAALGCRVLLRHHTLATQVLTPCRIDLLASGGLLCLLMESRAKLLHRWLPPMSVMAVAAAIWMNWSAQTDVYATRIGLVYYDVLAIIFAGFIWFAVLNPGHPLLTLRPLIALGRWSYGIYVYHVIILGFLPQVHPWLMFFGGIGLSIGVAALSWRFFERPINRLKLLFPRAAEPIAEQLVEPVEVAV